MPEWLLLLDTRRTCPVKNGPEESAHIRTLCYLDDFPKLSCQMINPRNKTSLARSTIVDCMHSAVQ
jgi:hypothetical protein